MSVVEAAGALTLHSTSRVASRAILRPFALNLLLRNCRGNIWGLTRQLLLFALILPHND